MKTVGYFGAVDPEDGVDVLDPAWVSDVIKAEAADRVGWDYVDALADVFRSRGVMLVSTDD